MNVFVLEREFTAKEVQRVLRVMVGSDEKIGLALLNYYARTNLVPCSGKMVTRGRRRYSYSDVILLCWLFRMKREGLPVNRFRQGIEYLRNNIPSLMQKPQHMLLLTDGSSLFIKHKEEDKGEIAEVITGYKSGQYVWAYAIGSLIEELQQIVDAEFLENTSNNSSANNCVHRAVA
jgi:hypothetical protein